MSRRLMDIGITGIVQLVFMAAACNFEYNNPVETDTGTDTQDSDFYSSDMSSDTSGMTDDFNGVIHPSGDLEISPGSSDTRLLDAAVYDAEMQVYNNVTEGLIKFALPPQCVGSTVQRAELTLSLRRAEYAIVSTPVVLYAIQDEWNEDTVTYGFSPIEIREVGRANVYNNDKTSLDTFNAIQTVTVDLATEFACIARDDCANNGFVIKPDISGGNDLMVTILTSEYPEKGYRPMLSLICVDGTLAAPMSSDTDSEPLVYDLPENTLMNPELIWYRNIEGRDDLVHPRSERIMNWVKEDPVNRGFTPGGIMMIDSSLKVLYNDDASATLVDVNVTHTDWGSDVGPIPLPPGGAVEAFPDYHCDADAADCHMLLIDRTRDYLFEYYVFDIPGGQYDDPDPTADFGAFWDLTNDYGWNAVTGLAETHKMGRGRDCTSADSAGFPIASLLPLPEEIVEGEVNHALRLVLPTGSIMYRRFVKPATHAENSGGGKDTFPYGSQLRLKSDSYLIDKYGAMGLSSGDDGELTGVLNGQKFGDALYPDLNVTSGANALIDAMQKYGVFLSDGGSYALTIASHQTSSVKYCQNPVAGCPDCCYEDPDRILGAFDLSFLDITDFEVIDNGATYFWDREGCQLIQEPDWQSRP